MGHATCGHGPDDSERYLVGRLCCLVERFFPWIRCAEMPTTIVSGPIIAAGQSLSSALDASASNSGITRITMPVQWTSAWLTFQISQDGVTYSDLYWPDGKMVTVTVMPGATIATDPDLWRTGYFKFRSGRPGELVAQEGTRNFTVVLS